MSASSMHQRFSTEGIAPHHEFGYWRSVIGDAYFNLQLTFPTADSFRGQLDDWNLQTLRLSRLESSALSYRRLRQHCQQLERQILVTVPLQSEVEFSQLGRDLRCQPGQFLLEYSDEPYEFRHGRSNTLLVLKLPESALQSRLGNASRYCAKEYDASTGVSRVFVEYVQMVVSHCSTAQPVALSLMGTQIIDLLALALDQAANAAQSDIGAVRSAHVARVEAFVRQHLFDAELSPQRIAQACGISLRYLHEIFRGSGYTLSEMIRLRRLQAAYEQLSAAGPLTSIAQVAYGAGFGDQAQFSRLFRNHYGLSPSELIRQRRIS